MADQDPFVIIEAANEDLLVAGGEDSLFGSVHGRRPFIIRLNSSGTLTSSFTGLLTGWDDYVIVHYEATINYINDVWD